MRGVLVSWSSGKDSAWTLHRLRAAGVPVAGIFCTINEAFDRVCMHGVRRELLEAQARALGLSLWTIPLPWPCSNETYEATMAKFLDQARSRGIDTIAFGDLFLADIRRYRERQLQGTGLAPVFPLWELPTAGLAREMMAGGLRAKITCVDPKALAPSFAGRDFDAALLNDLPAGVDPCGENGEFHSFAYAGPMFRQPIPVTLGEIAERDGFVFADLEPAGASPR